MRKKDDQLKGILLKCAQKTVLEKGPAAINIRELARQAGVATGTVYNYFSCKDEIILTITEEYWRQVLVKTERDIQTESFPEYLQQVYTAISYHASKENGALGGALMSSLQPIEVLGRKRMAFMNEKLHKLITCHLEIDKQIADSVWTEAFTMERYSEFILINLMAHLRNRDLDINFLIQIVKRTLYEK